MLRMVHTQTDRLCLSPAAPRMAVQHPVSVRRWLCSLFPVGGTGLEGARPSCWCLTPLPVNLYNCVNRNSDPQPPKALLAGLLQNKGDRNLWSVGGVNVTAQCLRFIRKLLPSKSVLAELG